MSNRTIGAKPLKFYTVGDRSKGENRFHSERALENKYFIEIRIYGFIGDEKIGSFNEE